MLFVQSGFKIRKARLFMLNHGFSQPVEMVLKRLRENLVHVNALIESLEYIEGGSGSALDYYSKRTAKAKSPGDLNPLRPFPVPRKEKTLHSVVKRKDSRRSLPPGYAEILLATEWPPDAESWRSFMHSNVRLPGWMLPAVQIVVHRRAWRSVENPLEQIRAASIREAARLGLRGQV